MTQVCYCALAGTAACKTCSSNPYAVIGPKIVYSSGGSTGQTWPVIPKPDYDPKDVAFKQDVYDPLALTQKERALLKELMKKYADVLTQLAKQG